VNCASLRYRSARLNVVEVEPKGLKCNLKNLECRFGLPGLSAHLPRFARPRDKRWNNEVANPTFQNYSMANSRCAPHFTWRSVYNRYPIEPHISLWCKRDPLQIFWRSHYGRRGAEWEFLRTSRCSELRCSISRTSRQSPTIHNQSYVISFTDLVPYFTAS